MIDKLTQKKREYEMMLMNKMRKDLYEKPVLNNLFLEVTSRCNARCEHCGSRCDGNTQGVARLIEGMDINEAIERLEGIDCRGRGTSCPDQLAQALIASKNA